MKTIRNTLAIGAALFLMVVADEPGYSTTGGLHLVSEAHAVFGVWRRHARRWAVVGTAAVATTAAVASADSAAAANQAAANQAASDQDTVASTQAQSAPAPAAPHGSIPLGTVVDKLPPDCKDTPVGGIDYQYCDGNFYRAVFQGNNLVYVTAQP